MMNKSARIAILFALTLLLSAAAGCGGKKTPVVDTQIPPVKIAVSSDFAPTARLLADEFTTNTAVAVEFTTGSDSELVQKILEGGDFDVFMSSDTAYPAELINKGKAISEGAQVYALGTVALYSKFWKLNWNAADYLNSGQFSSIAIPAPEVNRYGSAGIAALKNIRVYDMTENKLIFTANENESLELVKTKAADAGFVAYTSLSDNNKRWAWLVPLTIYDPIEQGAVLLKKDEIAEPAQMWMGYLKTDSARSIIRQSGYAVVSDHPSNFSN